MSIFSFGMLPQSPSPLVSPSSLPFLHAFCYLKNKFHPMKIKHILILLWFVSSFQSLDGQFSQALDKLAENSAKFPKEVVYLHTDREVYAPGDTIWFKAYIREKASLSDKTVSQTFNLKMINKEGIIVSDTKHLVFNAESLGQIVLENDFKEDFYHLVAYSSWMKNYSPDEVFRKTIRVKNFIRQENKFSCQLSKPHYLEGDTLQARIGFFDSQKNEVLDENVRVRIFEGTSLIRDEHVQLDIENIIDIPLPQTIEENISMRISTTHMGYYYDTITNLPCQYDLRVGFYPEGGNLINGLTNRIAFKAVSSDGIPINVEGAIYDDTGDMLFKVISEHDGMGLFMLTPDMNKKFYLQIDKPEGIEKKFYLPDMEDEGWLLQVVQAKGIVQVTAVNNYSIPETALITISMRGQLLHFMIDTMGSYFTKTFSTNKLQAGIAEVTLYDSKMQPCAERLVFLNQDRLLNVSLSTKYSGYLPRDYTELDIDLNEAGINVAEGSYSLAIVDNELCMHPLIDEGNIISRFLLSSGLKGSIYKPSYYFNEANKMSSHHLDLLLLTQGWRKYKSNSGITAVDSAIKSPKLKDIISGTLYTARSLKKWVPVKGSITIFNSGGTGDMATDDNGRFEFIHKYDTLRNPNIMLFGKDERGSTKVQIRMDKDSFEQDMEVYYRQFKDSVIRSLISRPDRAIQFDDRLSLNINNQWLEEVTIFSKNQEAETSEAAALPTARKATEIDFDASLYLNEVILNMGIPESWQVFWYMDDFPRPYSDIRYTNLEDVKEIIVLRPPDTQQYLPPEEEYVGITNTERVVALVYLKPIGSDNKQIAENNMVKLKRIELEKEFYKPLYNTEALRSSSIFDLRKTIHWEPRLNIEEDGTAKVKFYNGDRYTTVKCILEGMRKDGIPVYGEYNYGVVLNR